MQTYKYICKRVCVCVRVRVRVCAHVFRTALYAYLSTIPSILKKALRNVPRK